MDDREYRFLNEDDLNKDVTPSGETNVDALSGGLLDVIQVAIESGMTHDDVDEALRRVESYLARHRRSTFKLHIKDD